MTKRLHNWTYSHVTAFLREKGFEFFESVEQSHQIWVKIGKTGEPEIFVEVKFQMGPYSWKALEKIIEKSGVDQKQWRDWAGL